MAMPHLTIQYSSNLDLRADTQALCDNLRAVMAQSGIFPLGGIRVRAFAAQASSIADGHPDNAFADMILRMGAGRSDSDRHRAGEAIFAAAQSFLATEFEQPHFALSLEIVEIDAGMSWKENSIHPRLKANNEKPG
jgi:5-carboxymethyl-2-hydroxymuconate isomerase